MTLWPLILSDYRSTSNLGVSPLAQSAKGRAFGARSVLQKAKSPSSSKELRAFLAF